MRPLSPSTTSTPSDHQGSVGGTSISRKILPQFNDLTQTIRKRLLNHLAQQLRAAFTQADSTLFTCAEKAENNQVQEMFFESIRDVRKHHILIERAFLKIIANQFDDFIAGKIQPDDDVSGIDADQLSLVQTDDFEESLLVASMSNKVSERCIEALHGIEQRLALINSGKKLGNNSPLAPTVIANSFYTALVPSPFNLQVKTILYMLFEQFVMRELDEFYAATNQIFINAGVLPNLKYSAAQRKTPQAPTTASSEAETDALQESSIETEQHPLPSSQALNGLSDNAPSQAQSSTLSGQSVYDPITEMHSAQQRNALDETASFQAETINALFNTYRQQTATADLPDGVRSIAAFASSNATQEYSSAQLLNSLAQLQQKTAQQAAESFSIQTVDSIKNTLIEQLRHLSDDSISLKIPEQQANTIDLVGMLFNFIIEDASLSDTSKTILSNLHSLYLQVALQDTSLFTQHQHPARKLLNGMAQAGVLYCGASEESALQQKMQFTVTQALQSYKGDSTLFEYLIQDFNTFVAALKQRVELREKRAIEAAKGRDKLLAARNQARALIDSTIKRFPAPSIIRTFLEHTWVDVLVFAFLRHGPSSKQWQRYAEVAQQLAWSSTFLDKHEDQQRLEEIRISLLEDLRKGLDLLGSHHPDKIRQLLQDLIACQHAVQAQQADLAEKISSELPVSPLRTMLGEEEALSAPNTTENLSAKAQEIAYKLEHIRFGTWFEFDSPAATLKLSWFSPTTRNYMFVDSSGQRVAIKPLTTLAVEIEQGKVRIVSNTRTAPLMDRALSAIQKIFQHFNHSHI